VLARVHREGDTVKDHALAAAEAHILQIQDGILQRGIGQGRGKDGSGHNP
jgi:hypothetical protein